MLLASSALMISLASAACTDEPVQTTTNNDTNGMENNRQTQPPGEVPANSMLQHVEPCSNQSIICTDDVTFSAGRRLKVQLLSGDGTPAGNVAIKFEIKESDADGTNLSAANAVTNEMGIAETDLRAGTDIGTVRVLVSTSDPAVSPIEFVVSVNPKDASSFNVNFTEVGDTDARKVEAFLFPEGTSCDAFLNDPRSLTAEYSQPGAASAAGDLPTIRFAGIMNGTTYTVGARAFDRTNEDVEVAVGCVPSSDDTRVVNGMPVNMTVPLIKNLPTMVGEYEVVHQFNLVNALPDNIQTIINLIGVVVSDPGAFIIGCGVFDDEGELVRDDVTGKPLTTDTCPAPTKGLIGLVVDVLPTDGTLGELRDAIEGFLGSDVARDIAKNTVNDAIADFLADADFIPQWARDGVDITQDVTRTLQNFRVAATLRIVNEPKYLLDDNGMPLADEQGRLIATWETKENQHIWEDIILYWRRGCEDGAPPECGEAVEVDPNNVSDDMIVEGLWDGSVLDGNVLVINEHSLSLNYGTLILTVLEKVVIPQIFDNPNVNSVEAMLDELIDCESLSTTVADATISGAKGIVKTLCTQLKGQASDALRDYAEGLVFEGDERFVIGTPAGEGCALFGPDAYVGDWQGKPKPYIERMGKDEPASMLCNWDVKIKYDADSEPIVLDGEWNGKLK